jgi:hypothetical protein
VTEGVAVAAEDGAAVEWSSEVGAADWIVERLHHFASDVGSFVPEGWRPMPGCSTPPGPRVRLPGRSLALHRGPIEAAAAFCRPPAFQSPSLWWPADRAWCVASDIDLPSTHLGGTRALVEEVLRDGRLEAVPARLSDPMRP